MKKKRISKLNESSDKLNRRCNKRENEEKRERQLVIIEEKRRRWVK